MKNKTTTLTALIVLALIASFSMWNHVHNFYGSVGVTFTAFSIHSRVRIWKGTTLILDEYNAGAVTNIGDNQTLAWIFGDADYNITSYMANVTYLGIGNQGALSTASTVLPAEWNRTLGTIEDETQSQLNMTAIIYPDAGGPYTADCLGCYWESTGDGALWCYDTFTEVSGIDETFTINLEFQISVAHT